MTNSELYYFAGRCLSLDDHPDFRAEVIKKNQTGSIDWIRFVSLCSAHLILPTIYLKFKSHNILEYLPKELSSHLKEIYKLNLSRNQGILIQMKKITETLNQNNIFPVFLKGSGNLIDNLYSDTGERILGDIDFLVPEEDYLQSAKLLKEIGFYEVNPPRSYKDIKSLKHFPRMISQNFPAVIEIHRIPVREKYLKELNSEKIKSEWHFCSSIPGGYILSDKHKIILNFIHTRFGNEERPYSIISLRDIYDIYLLSKRLKLEDTLCDINKKNDARIYFEFARKTFNLSQISTIRKNLKYRTFSLKQTLFLNSSKFYRVYKTLYFLYQRIFKGYILQFIQLFYSAKVRREVFSKIGSKSWYKNHLQLYAQFFQRER